MSFTESQSPSCRKPRVGCQPVARIPVSRSPRGQPAGTRGTAGDVSAGVPGGQRSLARLERGSRGAATTPGRSWSRSMCVTVGTSWVSQLSSVLNYLAQKLSVYRLLWLRKIGTFWSAAVPERQSQRAAGAEPSRAARSAVRPPPALPRGSRFRSLFLRYDEQTEGRGPCSQVQFSFLLRSVVFGVIV